MSDITMCSGTNCPRKKECYRFTTYVNDEYTANKMMIISKKLGKKLKTDIEMVWQWVKKGKKLVIACDFHKYD